MWVFFTLTGFMFLHSKETPKPFSNHAQVKRSLSSGCLFSSYTGVSRRVRTEQETELPSSLHLLINCTSTDMLIYTVKWGRNASILQYHGFKNVMNYISSITLSGNEIKRFLVFTIGKRVLVLITPRIWWSRCN